MSSFNSKPFTGPSKPQRPAATNPFARALADTEREHSLSGGQPPTDNTNLFRDALAKTGGNFGDTLTSSPDALDAEKQQQEAAAQAKKERMRRELHRQINPVETTDVFNAREQQVKEEINKLRYDLKMLAQDVAKFDKQVELTLMTEITDPGQEGSYYLSFFQKLRTFIMFLRQKISSARTWATQMQTKKSKKKAGKGSVGMMIQGLSHEQTTTVQDMQHHERSAMYSGG